MVSSFQANSTFKELGDMKMMLEEFVKHGGGLSALSNNSESISTLKVRRGRVKVWVYTTMLGFR
jgi:hypothetical protein